VREAASLISGVNVLKIDAEGAELEILQAIRVQVGAQRTTLFIEILDSARDLRVFLSAFAREFDYHIAALGNDVNLLDAAKLPDLTLGARFGARDAILAPAEQFALLDLQPPRAS
jgi:hypothetical protein